MKKIIALLMTAVMLMSFTACGGNAAQGQEPASVANENNNTTAPAVPAGLYMVEYIGNEAGEYVEEMNVFTDFNGKPVSVMEMLYRDNSTIWCEIREDGTGTCTSGNYEPVEMDFNTDEPGMMKYGAVRQSDSETEEGIIPYHFDEETGRFWFEEQPGYWNVMKPCSQAALDLVFAGMGGSVPLAEAEIGDPICMGEYMQTENADKNEPIYWRVIDKDGDKVLLVSDKLLDSFSYNYNPEQAVLTDVTWENSSLRAFLNDADAGFLTMFTDEEIALIQTTHLENKAANDELMAQWGSFEDQGNKTYSDLSVQDRPDDPDTDDRVFLLSYQEVLKYFGEPTDEPDPDEQDYPFTIMKVNHDWIAYVTDAVQVGYYDNATRAGAWITRTLCNSHSAEDMVVYISSTGQVFNYFTYVPMFIRPAMWVSTGA